MSTSARLIAQNEFEKARHQAERVRLTSWLLGRDARLLPFDAIRRNLRQQSPLYRGIQDVPIEQVIGSVGRYDDMTRTFLPLNDAMKERWIKMAELARSEGWPPVELYKVGDVYFVRDGNHRLSAARQLNYPTVEAHVWEFPDEITINPDDSLDVVINRFREQSFLEATGLKERYPDYDIHFTISGRYPELLAQIEELRQKLGFIDEREVSFQEAADAWYELIYLPSVQIIRESGLLNAFPGRTEADLFAWMSFHRDHLREEYGEFENLADLAQTLMNVYRETPSARVGRRVRQLLGSDELPPLAGLERSQSDEEE
ncbi:MAG: hypothetical protein LC131_08370 [Anaerolineae bacterium]|nr:hypothetical protein [Promineifilum sp.]MCZ2113834.1 hypothetical protein [Anaerolineae bacterium]